MAATGELALLPKVSPVRVELADHNHRPRLFRQARIYRLPPGEKTNRFSYSPGGYHTLLHDAKGRIIDLYA